jgi:uncharacterized membrane protein
MRLVGSHRDNKAMADLLVIEFPSEAQAEEARQKLFALQREYLIELGDAVVAVKDADGDIKLNQTFKPVAAGAVSGALWGSLIGLIFLNPLLGAAVGAASGAVGGALTDLGIEDKFMKEVAASLHAGNAALFLLIRKVATEKVLERVQGFGGKVMRSSFDETREHRLQEALDGARRARAEAASPTAPPVG